MIIEAGYDLWELILPRLETDNAEGAALWLITMDDDLRLNSIRTISDRTDGSIVDHVADVVIGLASDYRQVGYFALAHRMDRVRDGIEQQVYGQDREFLESIDVDERCFLGRLVFDGEYMYQSTPRFSFRDYSLDHLPRAGVVRGPHPYDCECFACNQHNEKVAVARARLIAESAHGPQVND